MVYLESDIRGMQEDIPCCDRCIARDGYIRCKRYVYRRSDHNDDYIR